MKRLSLLAVAFTLLFSASGCCCGLFHGCGGCGYPPPCGSCGSGYAPAYASPAPCSTCPNGGCGVNGPVMQGAFYEGSSLGTAVGSASEMPTPAATSVAAANEIRTY